MPQPSHQPHSILLLIVFFFFCSTDVGLVGRRQVIRTSAPAEFRPPISAMHLLMHVPNYELVMQHPNSKLLPTINTACVAMLIRTFVYLV